MNGRSCSLVLRRSYSEASSGSWTSGTGISFVLLGDEHGGAGLGFYLAFLKRSAFKKPRIVGHFGL